MPGPIVRMPELWGAVDPKQASVFDLPGQGLLRRVVGLLGLDDPAQVMAFGTPVEVGASGGGVLDAVAGRFPRLAKAIKAYHGSPHEFDKFETAKIGTGEGAQAYGHGLYFAENEGVAQSYRDALGTVTASPQYAAYQDAQRVLADARIAHFQAPTADATAALKAAEARFRGAETAAAQAPKGRMYEVGINADPARMLDWDKPLSQQPNIAKLFPQDEQGRLMLPNGERVAADKLRGASAYHAVAEAHGGPVEASNKLSAQGVPGIQYLDQTSRAAGEGTRNFVIFDEKLVDILKKYGVALPVIEGLREQANRQGGRVDLSGVTAPKGEA